MAQVPFAGPPADVSGVLARLRWLVGDAQRQIEVLHVKACAYKDAIDLLEDIKEAPPPLDVPLTVEGV